MCDFFQKLKARRQYPSSIPHHAPDTHVPSELYLNGFMPTYTKEDLIEHLRYRISIHESYAGLVIEDPYHFPPATYGSYDYQIWAIEGYLNSIFYIEGGVEVGVK